MKQLALALSRSFRAALLEVEEVLGAPSVRPVAPVSRLEVGTVVYPAWDCDTDTPAFGLVCPDLDGASDPRWVTVQWSDRDHMSLHLVTDVLIAPGCELAVA